VELVRCTQVFNAEGHFCPYFDDTHKTVTTDQVILAIGQASETEFCKDFCFLDDKASLPVQDGLIVVDRQTQQTPLTGVFAGGDVASGPGTVVEAMAAGRRAAAAIDQFLGGDGILAQHASKSAAQSGYAGQRETGFAEVRRVAMPRQALCERKAGFKELELGFSEQAAREEARRCLQCDLERCLAQELRCQKH
jgi:NADH-quinone oxidoreductase subunit F